MRGLLHREGLNARRDLKNRTYTNDVGHPVDRRLVQVVLEAQPQNLAEYLDRHYGDVAYLYLDSIRPAIFEIFKYERGHLPPYNYIDTADQELHRLQVSGRGAILADS